MDDEKRANFSTSVRSVLKQRKTGVERLTWEDERRRRQKWSSEQCLAILKLVDKLLRTTGTMCDVRFFPETGNIMLHTSGKASYGESQLAYAAVIEYMQSTEGTRVPFDAAGAYMDFTGLDGRMTSRALCDALRRYGVPSEDLDAMDGKLQQMLVARGAAHSKALMSWCMQLGVKLATVLMTEDLTLPADKDHSWDPVNEMPLRLFTALNSMPAMPARQARTKASVDTEATAMRAAAMAQTEEEARTEEETPSPAAAAAPYSTGLGAEPAPDAMDM
mmetsp:Transcript_53185/g.147479  ORF Transcript_53185/g.147479 Transcript_53185/m.147479 type:complete len:276 (-) Transcript_53185:22-849(-)